MTCHNNLIHKSRWAQILINRKLNNKIMLIYVELTKIFKLNTWLIYLNMMRIKENRGQKSMNKFS